MGVYGVGVNGSDGQFQRSQPRTSRSPYHTNKTELTVSSTTFTRVNVRVLARCCIIFRSGKILLYNWYISLKTALAATKIRTRSGSLVPSL
jgi:hypothetical protein